jgi:hypothetical protein
VDWCYILMKTDRGHPHHVLFLIMIMANSTKLL